MKDAFLLFCCFLWNTELKKVLNILPFSDNSPLSVFICVKSKHTAATGAHTQGYLKWEWRVLVVFGLKPWRGRQILSCWTELRKYPSCLCHIGVAVFDIDTVWMRKATVKRQHWEPKVPSCSEIWRASGTIRWTKGFTNWLHTHTRATHTGLTPTQTKPERELFPLSHGGCGHIIP